MCCTFYSIPYCNTQALTRPPLQYICFVCSHAIQRAAKLITLPTETSLSRLPRSRLTIPLWNCLRVGIGLALCGTWSRAGGLRRACLRSSLLAAEHGRPVQRGSALKHLASLARATVTCRYTAQRRLGTAVGNGSAPSQGHVGSFASVSRSLPGSSTVDGSLSCVSGSFLGSSTTCLSRSMRWSCECRDLPPAPGRIPLADQPGVQTHEQHEGGPFEKILGQRIDEHSGNHRDPDLRWHHFRHCLHVTPWLFRQLLGALCGWAVRWKPLVRFAHGSAIRPSPTSHCASPTP